MRFQLLGPLSITDGRDVVVLPPSKPTALLAALLLRPGSVVSTDHLRGVVWGEEQPTTAKAALQSCVLRLRRIFAKYGIEDQAVVAVAGGYRIQADTETLDLLHFRQLVDRAGTSGEEAELYTLRAALALWQGPLLANVPSDLLHRDEVPRLAEERLRVLERVCDIELEHGRYRETLVDLWEVTRVYPAHERFTEQLMLALCRTGRQTEALAEYRRIKEHLREELGVDPRAELQRLELAILRGDDLGAVDTGRAPVPFALRGTHPGTGTPAVQEHERAAHHQQPAAPEAAPLPTVPGFTGRVREVKSLTELLTGGQQDGASGADMGTENRSPVAVLSGAPGIGKTALALHVAHLVRGHYPGGRLLLPLTRPDGTPLTAGEALGALREASAGQPGTGPTLLVLDDAVHPDQVRPLLAANARGATIVTSRMGLAALVATHGGTVHRLGALEPRESHALLTAVVGRERIGAEPSAALLLASVCGHHPLALRIAAARLLTRPRLRLADCADWLRRDLPARLSLADDPRMSVPLTLDEALERLPPALAEAHLRLGSTPHDVLTTGRAAAVLGIAEGTAEEVMERLLDAGLLEEGRPGAFWMHDLLRAHARRATALPPGPVPDPAHPSWRERIPPVGRTSPAALR
ncbi:MULTISPECIES: BTAD domain-containing putative transcriptional regulator [unclassified Streptomyces]|uniref:BTAD domain-containing putative transcriptional regulator n=1 Tax=unclassified Streptomyces TaxID=2593676 RepID=UPI000CD4BDA5|nr:MULTISPECIES: BTAD domain-containing putative transcriptional regulator [unclassified Streptomyces]AWL41207.1 AfsR family transcriptional regulator [Streptomyces sp. SM18]